MREYVAWFILFVVAIGTAGYFDVSYGAATAVVCSLLVIGKIGLNFFLQWLAERYVLFTTIKEGTIKAIMRGRTFERFIMSFEGFHLNDPSKRWYDPTKPAWEVLSNNGQPDSAFDTRLRLLRRLGIYWVGWPWANRVYTYAFEWNETKTNTEGKAEIWARAEITDFAYVSDFTYAIETDEAETKERLQVDLLTLVTIAITNPYRALFSGEDWMRRITAAINRHARSYVGRKQYADLITTGADSDTSFSGPIIRLKDVLPDDAIDAAGNPTEHPAGLKERYGITVRTADLQTIELSGDLKDASLKAATAAYVAEQTATATRTTGQAEADVIEMKGRTEAQALRVRLETMREFGDQADLLVQADAMQAAAQGPGNTTFVWANNPFAQRSRARRARPQEGSANT